MPITKSKTGYKFKVRAGSPTKVVSADTTGLIDDLAISYEEPKQVSAPPTIKSQAQVEAEAVDPKQRIEDAKKKFEELIAAQKATQTLLDKKLETYAVNVDPARNPTVRDAIRRIFGADTSIVSNEMYRKSRDLLTQLRTEQRKASYGAGSRS
jgi:hypothetical protein